jgi:hypothetical protein
VIPAPAHGAGRQAACGELGRAGRAQASKLDERPGGKGVGGTVDGEDRAGLGLDVNHVVVRAAVLVGAVEGPPTGREREATVPADQIPHVGHVARMAELSPVCGRL